jgi:hypothetical protein
MLNQTTDSTAAAALAARASLAHLAAHGAPGERRMADVARAAIFEEALLGALRSRFNELRTVAK